MAILESHLADRLRKSMQNQCLGFDEAVGGNRNEQSGRSAKVAVSLPKFIRIVIRRGGVVPIYEGKWRPAVQRFGSRPVQMGPNWE